MTIRYYKNDKVFTKLSVVEYLLDEVEFKSKKNLAEIRLLEPASGEGSFAIEIIKRLYESSLKFKFDFIKALNQNIRFVELNQESMAELKEQIINLIENLGESIENLEMGIFIENDFLLLNSLDKFHVIVGNPPYIRHELIDKEKKILYKEKFSTFKYRADLYILFYEHSLNLLYEKGKLSFVCSNRWLYNQYGELLREKIATEYHLKKVINIEKSQLFNNRVIAYPSIITIENTIFTETLYFESNQKEIDLNTLNFLKRETPKSKNWQNLFVDYDLDSPSLKGIEEQGFTIGIGVATGADSVFIINKSQNMDIESSRLIPLIKSNALKNKKIEWDGSLLINPYDENGLCNLEDYPKMKSYLINKQEKLKKRYIAKKTPLNWYKTIDRVKLDLLEKPKILLPDLAKSDFIHIDEGNFYPHHNLYYITHEDKNKLKILASILMSDFVKKQLYSIGIKMNGGVPRFQVQTLKKLRIPNIEGK